jgi:quinol monooxygenase YgiN
MEDAMPSRALLIRLQAQPGMDEELQAFLNAAQVSVRQEAGARAWYALRFGRGEYGVFEAFADDSQCEAQLRGPVSLALMQEADNALLAQQPQFQRLDLLASKLPRLGEDVALTKGLLLCFQARAGHAPQVEQFLIGALELVQQEAGTLAWFALRLEHGRYGIFDVFGDSGERFAHLVGQLPRELARHAFTLLGGMPEMHLLDVLAHTQES